LSERFGKAKEPLKEKENGGDHEKEEVGPIETVIGQKFGEVERPAAKNNPLEEFVLGVSITIIEDMFVFLMEYFQSTT
jgi:hypothetical protein